MKSLLQILNSKKRYIKAAEAFLVMLYAALFCYFSFSGVFDHSETRVDDNIVQRGVAYSADIKIIGITTEDIEYFDMDSSEIAAKVAYYFNTITPSAHPAAISLDIPINTMTEEAKRITMEASKFYNNLVLPVDLSMDENSIISSFDLSENSIVVTNAVTLDDAFHDSAFFGHTAKVYDKCGAIRHAVFDITTTDGYLYHSMPYMSYRLYCEAHGIECRVPRQSSQHTAIIKFASRTHTAMDYCARDLLQGAAAASEFDGRIVYIGYYDASLDPGYMTAIDYGSRMHSAELDANITNDFLTNNFAVSLAMPVQLALLFFGIIAVAAVVSNCAPFAGICFCIIYYLFVRIVALLFFGIGYISLSMPHIVNAILTGILTAVVAYAIRTQQERTDMENLLSRYVDVNIAREALHRDESRYVITQDRGHCVNNSHIAVMFADIRNFTGISESVPAGELVAMLNECLSMMADCITKYGGTLDKFIGDCAMAYWGAPISDDDPVYHACLAATEMQRRAKEISHSLKERVGIELNIGIGINYGDAVVGNIGSADRLSFTAVGDTVNTASRLEEQTPPGAIYLTESARDMLGDRGEVEDLFNSVHFRGKKKVINVYELRHLSIQEARQKAIGEIQQSPVINRRIGWALFINVVLACVQMIFTLNVIREYGIGYLSFFTVTLAALSGCIAAGLIPYNIRCLNHHTLDNVRPRWMDVLLLTALVANLQAAVAYLVSVVSKVGPRAYLGGIWPGGIMIYAICPALSMLNFFLSENRTNYRWRDAILAELPIAGLLIICIRVAQNSGLDYSNPEIYQVFYSTPRVLLTVVLETIGSFFILHLYKQFRLQQHYEAKEKSRLEQLRNFIASSKLWQVLDQPRYANLVYLGGNAIIGYYSIMATVRGYRAGGIRIYSNPSLVGIIVLVACVICSIYNIKAIILNGNQRSVAVYRYADFSKVLGCIINFMSAFILAISGEGASAFIEPRWNADATVFLLCPILATTLWLLEYNDYRLWMSTLMVIPYALMLPLSSAAIHSKNLSGRYAMELENFYDTREMLAVILGEIIVAIVMVLLNMLSQKVHRENKHDRQRILLSVCGSRNGISTSSNTSSEFGLHSECYVIRDKDYAIVINTGSGLSNAKEKLVGCNRVDILLPSRKFSYLMGLLTVPNICPGARIRIFSDFDTAAFSAKPFWPVNIIRGTDIMVPHGRKVRLTDSYMVEFVPIDESGWNLMIRISGKVNVCYCANVQENSKISRRMINGSDLLIFDGYEQFVKGCYYAIDCNVPYLLISGFPSHIPDEQLLSLQREARNILEEVSFAREGQEYPIALN